MINGRYGRRQIDLLRSSRLHRPLFPARQIDRGLQMHVAGPKVQSECLVGLAARNGRDAVGMAAAAVQTDA